MTWLYVTVAVSLLTNCACLWLVYNMCSDCKEYMSDQLDLMIDQADHSAVSLENTLHRYFNDAPPPFNLRVVLDNYFKATPGNSLSKPTNVDAIFAATKQRYAEHSIVTKALDELLVSVGTLNIEGKLADAHVRYAEHTIITKALDDLLQSLITSGVIK